MMLKEEYKALLIKTIVSYLPDCTIYLFGSRARGSAHPGSDIDLALDAGKKIDWKVLIDMYELMRSILEKTKP